MNKISILLLTVTIYVVYAEPLRNQQSRQFARQEATTEQEEASDSYPQSTTSSGPYAPSGWKLSGRLLVLPARQQQQRQQYLPTLQYGAPTTEYGSPDDDVSSTQASQSTASNLLNNETTDEPESEIVNVEDIPSQVQANLNIQPQQPGYFVQLADGSIQRVLYVTSPAQNTEK